jgi:hypothetical protein
MTNETDSVDPFNLGKLREPQSLVQVKQRRLSIPVRKKPSRQAFVRVHPDPEFRINMPLFTPDKSGDSRDDEAYFVHDSVVGEMLGEFQLWTIFAAVDTLGNPFLWRIRVPPEDGREPNPWLLSNRAAAEQAMDKWIRVASDIHAGAYKIFVHEGQPPDPVWPQESFLELLKLGFKNRMIDRPDHPIILQLRGLA